MPYGLRLKRVSWLLLALTLLFILMWQAPAFYAVESLRTYLPLHMAAETFSIVVSMLVFGIAWNAYSRERAGNVVILGSALCAVGLLDFAHMLSYKGMPVFITPGSEEKAINFWLAARLLTALTLLVVAFRDWRPLTDPRSRYVLLGSMLVLAFTVIGLGLFLPGIWPHTFVPGQGLTPFKVGAEDVIVGILVVAAMRFYLLARKPQPFDVVSLFAATAITILSELSLTLYSHVADVFNLLGHLYKVLAYIFIYRAVFVASVREPFRRLDAELEEKKRIAGELRSSQALLDSIVEHMPAMVFLKKAGDLRFELFNRAGEELLGYDRQDLLGKSDADFFPAEQAETFMQADRTVLSDRTVLDVPEEEIKAADGTEKWLHTLKTGLYDADGNPTHLLGISLDISEQKRTAQALADSEYRFSQLFENLPEAFAVHEIICDDAGKPVDYRFLEVNPAFETLTGIPADGLIGKTVLEVLPATEAYWIETYGKVALTGEPVSFQNYAQALDRHYDVRAFSPRPGQFASLFSDVTEQKKMALDLAHANRAMKTLSTVNRELVHAREEVSLMQAICEAIVAQGGYRMAWVGYARDNVDKDVDVVACTGVPEALVEVLRPGWGEGARALGPTGRAVRTGMTQLSRDLADEPDRAWKDALQQAGCRSSVALPLKLRAGGVYGVLHVYSGEHDGFASHEIALLEEMGGDLSFGVDVMRMRLERDEALRRNEESLEETISAMAKAAEARDPYNAGHQRRVADLTVAIGRRMGLGEDALMGLHVAGTIHDIGKLQVPAEILNRPSRLDEMEMMLVREHVRVGYEILKDIRFPWPVAEVAYQHHERMDGSGYPQGLKGDEICLEARIVAVADVVEAMNSHRPYRPSLGLEAALAEIRDHRGSLYDAEVVDACLAVFAEGFRLD